MLGASHSPGFPFLQQEGGCLVWWQRDRHRVPLCCHRGQIQRFSWRSHLLPSAYYSLQQWEHHTGWLTLLKGDLPSPWGESFPPSLLVEQPVACSSATVKCAGSLASGEAKGSLLVLALWCWADWSSLLHRRLPVMPRADYLISLCVFSPSMKIAPSLSKMRRELQTAKSYWSSALLRLWC